MSDFDDWCIINGVFESRWAAERAWNYKQQKIDSIRSKLNDIYNACDENETVAMLLDSIQELL